MSTSGVSQPDIEHLCRGCLKTLPKAGIRGRIKQMTRRIHDAEQIAFELRKALEAAQTEAQEWRAAALQAADLLEHVYQIRRQHR